MNLILLEPDEITAAGEAMVADARADHLRTVLQVREGQAVRAGIVDGPLGTGTVTRIDGRAVTLQCAFEQAPPPRPAVDLLLAVPRPKVLRRLWAQLAALGVGQIVLTNAARVERPYFDTHVLTPACYRPLLLEGLQQARDTRLPVVSVHRQFRPLVEDELDAIAPDTIRVAADPREPTLLQDVLQRQCTTNTAPRRVLLAIGPEGGWNDFERSLLEAHGFRRAGLGARTLRTDTACIALLGIVHSVLMLDLHAAARTAAPPPSGQ